MRIPASNKLTQVYYLSPCTYAQTPDSGGSGATAASTPSASTPRTPAQTPGSASKVTREQLLKYVKKQAAAIKQLKTQLAAARARSAESQAAGASADGTSVTTTTIEDGTTARASAFVAMNL